MDHRRGRLRRVAATAAIAAGAWLSSAAPAQAVTPLADPDAPSRSGRTLTSDTGSWLCVGSCAYTYTWQRCRPSCATVPGATGPSYLLTTADIGASIRSQVRATDLLGFATRPSAQTAPIAAAPPVNVTPPTASGTSRVGATLTATLGVWNDPSPANVAYARIWIRCTTLATGSCEPVSTASTYVPGTADVGRFIRRVEVAEGLGAAAAYSTPLGTIQPLPAAAQGTPFTSGGGSTEPSSDSAGRRLSPFPVVIIAGRLSRGRTAIREFTVRGPRRSRVRLRCRGRGCPFSRLSRTIGRRKRVRIRAAERSYRAGNVVEVRVTGGNLIGKFTRLRFRRRGAPARRDLCLNPGASRPTRCS